MNSHPVASPSPLHQIRDDLNCLQQVTFQLCLFQLFIFAYFLAIHTLCANQCSGDNAFIANSIGQICMIVAYGYALYRLISQNSKFILNPIFALLATNILFFGFGPFAHAIADERTKLYLFHSAFGANYLDIIRANLLVSVGNVFVLLSFLFAISSNAFRYAVSNLVQLQTRKISVEHLAATLIAIGLAIKYCLIIPFRFEQVSWTLPSIIISLPFLADIGFCLIAYGKNQIPRARRSIYFILWTACVFLTLLEFLKLSIVTTLLLPLIGNYLRNKNIMQLGAGCISIMMIFNLYQPICLQGRQLIYENTGSIYKANLFERIAYLQKAILLNREIDNSSDRSLNKSLIRVSMVGAQTQAMKLYDNGQSAKTYENLIAIITPRFLWPDKPAVVLPGKVFYSNVSRRALSQITFSITLFGDGYWNFGWTGVIAFSILMGLICGMLSLLSHSWLVLEKHVYFPSVFLGVHIMAVDIYDNLLTGLIVPVIVYAVVTIFVSTVTMTSGQNKYRSMAPSKT